MIVMYVIQIVRSLSVCDFMYVHVPIKVKKTAMRMAMLDYAWYTRKYRKMHIEARATGCWGSFARDPGPWTIIITFIRQHRFLKRSHRLRTARMMNTCFHTPKAWLNKQSQCLLSVQLLLLHGTKAVEHMAALDIPKITEKNERCRWHRLLSFVYKSQL